MRPLRFGVFAKLTGSYLLAVVFTLSAVVLGVLSIVKFNSSIQDVTLSKLPTLTHAYQLGQQSEAIVASAPLLVRVQSQAQRETISYRIADRVRWLQELIDALDGLAVDPVVLNDIKNARVRLLESYAALDQVVQTRIEIEAQKQRAQSTLQTLLKDDLGKEQFFYTQWGQDLREIAGRLMLISASGSFITAQNREQFEAKVSSLLERDEQSLPPQLEDDWHNIRPLLVGDMRILALQDHYQDVLQRIEGILAENERLSNRFVYSVNELIRQLREQIQQEGENLQALVEARTNLLTALAIVCVLFLGGIGFLVVRRTLKRLNQLKEAMQAHARNQVAEIPLEGNDEISDMGDALRFFVQEIHTRESLIKDNEERFRDMTDATSDWFWETDADIRYRMVSEKFFETTRLRSNDIIGVSQYDFVARWSDQGTDQTSWKRHWQDLAEKRRFRDFILTIECPDGVRRQMNMSGKPVFDEEGTFIGYRGTGSDVTKEIQARSRLLAANEIMPGAFALWNHQGGLVMCNRQYYQYYRLIADLVQPNASFDSLVTALYERGGIDAGDNYVEQRLAFRKDPHGVFLEAMSDGRYLQVREAVTFDGGVVSLIVDITDRIDTEKRLELARKEAETANQAKSKFLAAASHDLRQPLHAIGMFLSALGDRRRRHQGEDESVGDDLRIIDNITDSLDGLRDLLNSLLDISKLDAGVLTPSAQPTPLYPLIDRLYYRYVALAEQAGLRLKVYCPDHYVVHTDPILLERVLSNLISNAVRYTHQGGVIVGVRHEKGDQIRVQVSDTGVGIPRDKVADIFMEFQQLDNDARDRRRGLGLGLAIVERIVTLLKHKLGVKSIVGRGSSFSISLPLSDEKPVLSPIEANVVSKKQDLFILVIDDESDVLEGMGALLSGWGYRSALCATTEQAVNLVKEAAYPPDLILADYRLNEECTGAEAIQTLCQEIGFDVPAAIITGDTAPDRIQEARASGFMCLHKPLRPAKLRQLIRNVEFQKHDL